MTKRQNNSAEIKAIAISRNVILIFDTLRTAGKDGVVRVLREDGDADGLSVEVTTAHGLSSPLWNLISCFMGQSQTVAGEPRDSVAS
jgi:hypothetical protein